MNIKSVCVDVVVKFCDSGSNGSRDIRLPHFVTDDDERTLSPGGPLSRTFVQYLIAFSTDRKQPVTSHPADLCGRLTSISLLNIVILSQTVLDKFHPKPSKVPFSTFFFATTSDRKSLMTSYAVGIQSRYGCPYNIW